MRTQTEDLITGWSNEQLLNVVRVAFGWAVSAGGMSEEHSQAYQRLLDRRLSRAEQNFQECFAAKESYRKALARCRKELEHEQNLRAHAEGVER